MMFDDDNLDAVELLIKKERKRRTRFIQLWFLVGILLLALGILL